MDSPPDSFRQENTQASCIELNHLELAETNANRTGMLQKSKKNFMKIKDACVRSSCEHSVPWSPWYSLGHQGDSSDSIRVIEFDLQGMLFFPTKTFCVEGDSLPEFFNVKNHNH